MPLLPNVRQESFAQAICAGTLPGEAYRVAGYKVKNDATASACGSRMLINAKVAARIAELRQIALAANEVTTTRIVRELARIAFADPRKVLRWGNNVIQIEEGEAGPEGKNRTWAVINHQFHLFNSSELGDDAAAAISEIKHTADGSITVKFHPKLPALVKLGEHMGLFTGESVAPPATTINSDNRTLVYVDRPPDETAEQWEARQRERLGLDESVRRRAENTTNGSAKRSH